MTNSNCAFCEIVAGGQPSVHEVYRDNDVVAFFPLEPATHGHTLIVPTRHVANVWGMKDAELSAVSVATGKLAKAIRDTLSPDGLNVVQSNGQAATQTVEHLHVHLVPRWAGDRMPQIWPAGTEETPSSINQAATVLRAALSGVSASPTPEDRRQHLGFIQAVVTRMAQASSSAKAWLLPIITATYGFAITKNAPLIALLGIVAVIVFGILDANYLKQERAFRKLYDAVAVGGPIPAFSMNSTLAGTAGASSNYWPDWKDLKSWAIAPVYGPLLLTGIAIALYTWRY